jgi:ankyrin repeat protein
MADYIIRSPVDGTIPTHDYTDDDRPAVVSDDEDAVASGGSDDEGPPERNEKPIHKQLNEFKKRVLAQTSGIVWEDVWRDFDLIDDRPGNGQSEIDDRTALHILVAEHNQAQGTADKDASQALIKAIANITKRYPGLVSRLDKSGKTPLYDAITNRQARVVRNMVKHCGSRKVSTASKDHPLVQAIEKHCSYKTGKENALHIAFREMPKAVDKETLKTMCEHATEEAVAYPDYKGFTPLHYAVRYRHSSEEQFEMIEILLRKGQATRENPLSPVKDVLDHYASVKVDNQFVRMSVFEYHMSTRKTYDQETSSAIIARGKRSGKDGDAGKAGKHNDRKRDAEQSSAMTADGKRIGSTVSAQASVQHSAGAHSKPGAEQGKSERIPERFKDERTGKGYKDERTGPTGKGSKERDEKNDSGKHVSQAKLTKQGGHRTVDEQKAEPVKESAPANIGIMRSNTGAPAAVKPKIIEPQETAEEKKKRRDEWSDKIQNELKIQILRNRPFDQATRFLYGKNLNNIHIYFDYQGQATVVEPSTFEDSFKNVKFDSILKYVAFPHVKVQGWNKHLDNPLKDVETRGRSDMLFFFQWLRRQGVKRVLKVIVDDVHPEEHPHSDEAIERCLKGMGVEELAWQKKDLDPDTICRIDGFGDDLDDDRHNDLDEEDSDDEGNPRKKPDAEDRLSGTLRTLHLWWNGDNAVLRGWSDPEGLRGQLPQLARVHVTTRKVCFLLKRSDWASLIKTESGVQGAHGAQHRRIQASYEGAVQTGYSTEGLAYDRHWRWQQRRPE